MQREIKFRGQEVNSISGWVYGSLITLEDPTTEKISYYIRTWDSNIEVEPESIGQFTGLTNNEGTPIYEGDIIEYRVSEKLYSMYNKRRCIAKATIEYIDDSFKTMEFYNEKGYGVQSGYWWKSCEVIGNIYETPSLLTPTNK